MSVSSLDLRQRRALDRAKERLVGAAEDLLRDGGVVGIAPKDFGQSQMRNLIAVALSTESPAVVCNFIRYQMGRDKNKRSWASGDARRLGDLFLDQIEKDEGVVRTVLAGLTAGDATLFPDDLARQLARMELVRQFLGFVDRHLKYLGLQRTGEEENGSSRDDEEDAA
jgi:hypothetical protein